MQIHALIERSTVNGPGTRAVVFLQGCSLRCPGCQNPETHRFTSKRWMNPFELADWILTRTDITGVTFSGGEPMEQLEDALDVVVGLIRQRRPNFSIGVFTGYTKNELDMGDFRATWDATSRISKVHKQEAWGWFETQIDWAVMGRYNQLQPCSEPMRSSRNQDLIHFSGRDQAKTFPEQALELTVNAEGTSAQITGFPQGVTCEIATT